MSRAQEIADLLSGVTITTADNLPQLTLKSTDADGGRGPDLVLTRDSASPADGDAIGFISWTADNDAGAEHAFCGIEVLATDVSDGSEDATWQLFTQVGGTSRSRFSAAPSETVFNEDSIDLDFRVESNGNANMLFVDAGNDRLLVGTTTFDTANVGHAFTAAGFAHHTRDANQVLILNRKTDDGDILEIRRDDTAVGSIGSKGGDLTIGTGVIGVRFEDSNNAIVPFDTGTLGSSDNDIDLGKSSVRWNDLYLGGNLYIGGTGSANALSDYEEGTFSAVLDNVSVGYGSRSGRYTKIGNTVFVHLEIATTSLDTTDGSAYQIGGLPFTADGGGVLFTYDSENSTSLTQKSTRLGARMNNGLSSVRLSRDGSDYAYNNGTQSAGSIVCTLQYFTSQ